MMNEMMETIKAVGVVFSCILGGVGVLRLIITPMLRALRARKEESERFHKSLEDKISGVSDMVHTMNKSIRLMQRERLESGFEIYVRALGYCPSGEKEILEMIYNDYVGSGENHIAKSYLKQLKETPNIPKALRD